MNVFSHLFCISGARPASALVALAGSLVLLAGCFAGENQRTTYLGSTPAVTGNTLDRYNDLAVVPPHSENLSISYDYGLVSDPYGDVVPAIGETVWFFVERGVPAPESFVHISLVGGGEASAESETPGIGLQQYPAETLRLGALDYVSRMACVDSSDAAGQDLKVNAVLQNIAARGYRLSKSVFVRSFEAEKAGLDGRRLSVLFTRDITRLGFDCQDLGDLTFPAPGADEVVEDLRAEASRSFEVIQ